MPTAYISFDEGTTRKVRSFQRTDDGDTVEEWMYAQSESIFDTYGVVATGVAGSTANSHLVQVMAGGSLRVGIKRIILYQAMAANAAANIIVDLYRLSTAGSGGTALTPRPIDVASAASGATARTLPSTKGTETTHLGRHRGAISTTASTVGLNPVLDLRFGDNNTKPIYIAAGTSNGFCIKLVSADTTVTYDVYVELIEAGWA